MMLQYDGQQLIERIVCEQVPCPNCGYRARISRQTAALPPAGLVGRVLGDVSAGAVVESRARVVEAWTFCLQCLRRDRWGWKGGEWKVLETIDQEVTDGA